jgi:polar amino acid transport system substrate-binding protein
MTQAGKVDGAIGASKNDGKGLIFPTEELARTRMAFYVRKGSSWRFTARSSISEVTIGAIAGYDYRNWLNTYIRNNRDNFTKVQVITGDEPLKRNLTKLMLERIDVVVDNEAVIQYVAKNIGISDNITCAGHDSEPSLLYIAFSPRNPQSSKYAEMLSQGIIRLRENGELKEILDKYGVSDWK